MFRKRLQSTILTDEHPLDEFYIPPKMMHRERQLDLLIGCLNTRGVDVTTALLYGGSGTGKTTAVLWAFREFEKHSSKVKPVYINVFEYPTRFDILFLVASSVYPFLHKKGTSTSTLLERIKEDHAKTGRHFLVCLDEVDQLRDTSVFYNLRALKCGLVLISSDRDVLHNLNIKARVESRISLLKGIEFPEYSTGELRDILKDRVQQAFEPDAIGDYQLAEIAARIKNRHGGDARVALRALKKAALLAEREGKRRIEDDHIRKAWEQTNNPFTARIRARLNVDQRVLLGIIEKHGEIPTGDLYEEYRARTEREGRKPVEQVTVRKYMRKMVRLGIVKAEGEGRWRRYQVA